MSHCAATGSRRQLTVGSLSRRSPARLVISLRTAEHHISAVLRKIGEPTRARAVATALRTRALDAEG